MSVDYSEMVALRTKFQSLQNDVPDVMDRLAVAEGIYARDQARKICTEDGIVNTGNYRRNFKCSTKALRSGNYYTVDIFNNLDYAKPLEYGFRSHFVPGHWDGGSFVYNKNDPEGGMYVGPRGGYVRGHFTLRRAKKETQKNRVARLNRKIDRIINDHLK